MSIIPRLVIIGPQPGMRRTYNLHAFPIMIGSKNSNITITGGYLAPRHILLDKDADGIKIKAISDRPLIYKRLKTSEKIIEDRDVFIAGAMSFQFFIPPFGKQTDEMLVLEHLTSNKIGETVLFDSDVSIGRKPSNKISLPFQNVSGKHCVCMYKNPPIFRDLNSCNGSRINGKKVPGEIATQLEIGDIIDIASYALYLRPASYTYQKTDDKMYLYLSEAIPQPKASTISIIGEYKPLPKGQKQQQKVLDAKISAEDDDFIPIKPEEKQVLLEISSNRDKKVSKDLSSNKNIIESDDILMQVASEPKAPIINPDNNSDSQTPPKIDKKLTQTNVQEPPISEESINIKRSSELLDMKRSSQSSTSYIPGPDDFDDDLLFIGPDEDFAAESAKLNQIEPRDLAELTSTRTNEVQEKAKQDFQKEFLDQNADFDKDDDLGNNNDISDFVDDCYLDTIISEAVNEEKKKTELRKKLSNEKSSDDNEEPAS